MLKCCYTILYYTMLYCIILYYTILYYTILHYTIPRHAMPRHAIPRHAIPYYIIPISSSYIFSLFYVEYEFCNAISKGFPAKSVTNSSCSCEFESEDADMYFLHGYAHCNVNKHNIM